MDNKKEILKEKLKKHAVDISMVLLIVLIGFVIYQSKKHEKEKQVNNIVNVLKYEKTR